jgi:hypothetical protein
MSEQNQERLLRAIRCLQLIQRTNAPKSTIFKAAGKALAPLMDEQSTMPPLPPRTKKPKPQAQPPQSPNGGYGAPDSAGGQDSSPTLATGIPTLSYKPGDEG